MVILLNGAFGVGKTTAARLLSARLPRSGVFDPETAGVLLQRTANLAGRSVPDFQDLALWRRLLVHGVRAALMIRPITIVPMAFSDASYLREIREGIGAFEPSLLHFCLVAPAGVVQARLRTRNRGRSNRDVRWQERRAAECCLAHASPEFAEHVETGDLDAEGVANELLSRVEAAGAGGGAR